MNIMKNMKMIEVDDLKIISTSTKYTLNWQYIKTKLQFLFKPAIKKSGLEEIKKQDTELQELFEDLPKSEEMIKPVAAKKKTPVKVKKNV